MKKFVLVWALFFCLLTGCTNSRGAEEGEEHFSISPQLQEQYELEIENTLNSFYWRYDQKSISYFQQTVPNKEDEKYDKTFEASEQSGFALKDYAGKQAVVAAVNLLHFNADKAGIAYFYFVKDTLVGVYYNAANHIGVPYSLKDRNVYSSGMEFKNFETEKPMADYMERRSSFPVEGFCTVGKNSNNETIFGIIDSQRVFIYRYRNGLQLYRRMTPAQDGLVPISASFYPTEQGDGIAVLMGSIVQSDETQEDSVYTVSEKVLFYNDTFSNVVQEIVLPSSAYSCVSLIDGHVVLVNDKILEYYSLRDGQWVKDQQYYLNHRVTGLQASDLDNDGSLEYLMTDGMDFYIYRKEKNTFKTVWRTHLSIASLDKNIYIGDLNQDGVKEIYICDATGTTIRYILSEKGIISQNDDIDYGQRFFVGDFNSDGKDDYIKILDVETNNQSYYIAG